MSMSNTLSSYGSIAKAYHWTLAIAIFALIALGITASELPADTSEQITVKATLFSIHKTLGLAVFALALLRILWALSQPKPAPLNPEKPVELLMAQIAHWLLYASLLLVPLSGWIHHAATTGFAPIWWPFGQSLPFVPKDPQVADAFGGLHVVFERVLVFTLVLHMAGALKHHFWDRDDTLRRMLPGMAPRGAPAPYAPKKAPAFVAPASALGVLLVALSIGASLGLYSKSTAIAAQPPLLADAPAAAQTESAWIVGSGDIAISIRQLGSGVTGRFADWTAEIDFAEEAVDGRHGSVRTTIAIPSLTLGSVTSEAMNAAYFDAETFPTATFTADLLSGEADGAYIAEGSLTVKGTSLPLALPFTLAIEGDSATASLTASVDRRDFGIGLNQADEGTLGFDVAIDIRVTATRSPTD